MPGRVPLQMPPAGFSRRPPQGSSRRPALPADCYLHVLRVGAVEIGGLSVGGVDEVELDAVGRGRNAAGVTPERGGEAAEAAHPVPKARKLMFQPPLSWSTVRVCWP